MKLPFNGVISTVLKPHMVTTRNFCQHPAFMGCIYYIYFYGILGFVLSLHHLRLHLGEIPMKTADIADCDCDHFMLVHDLKIIAASMGLVQYSCMFIGCFTENPALFLPHIAGQAFLVTIELVNVFLIIAQLNVKSLCQLKRRVPALILMTFNWLQEFCVFRRFLCICDL
ncbi:uncharacterized protein LOC128673567 [Plodia interpunctella]|uniref:uncharacterized protein LOC128673567 n=1 Tax=Plodia interpunctella TaxID=58824 RepID=UPI00236780DA|nr:uncharacterized protein LOC128673567 [Plodia interpunctella]